MKTQTISAELEIITRLLNAAKLGSETVIKGIKIVKRFQNGTKLVTYEAEYQSCIGGGKRKVTMDRCAQFNADGRIPWDMIVATTETAI